MFDTVIYSTFHLDRSNRYDGVLEYWVIIKEGAEHTESLTQEEIHRQKKKAGNSGDQTSQPNMSQLPPQVDDASMPKIDEKAFQKLEDQKSRDDASSQSKGPDKVATEVEAIGLITFQIHIHDILQWLNLYRST